MRVTLRRDPPDRDEAAVRFGIATAARDIAISVGIMLGLLYLFPVFGRMFSSPGWRGDQRRIVPAAGGLRFQVGPSLRWLPVSAPAGPGLLVALAVGALVVGALLLRFCDA